MALSAGAVVAQFDGDFKGLNKGLQQAQSKVDGFTGGLANAGKRIGAVFAGIGTAALNASKIIGVAGVGFATFGVKTAGELQSLSASFETLTGSAEKGRKVFMDLKKMGATTPFETRDLAKATQTMLSFGMSVEDAQKNLGMLGDISLGNKEKLAGLTLAFAQVQSTGKLMGQDLLQMINQGFNPLQIISEKTGKSMGVLKDEMADGKITAQMVADAFKTATSEGGLFYKGMEKGSQTLNGTFSTLMDNIGNMAAGLVGLKEDGTILEGSLLNLVQNGVNKLNEALSKIDWVAVGQAIQNNLKKAIDDTTTAIQNTINWYNQYRDIINLVMELIVSFGSAFLILRGIVIGYNIVMAIANVLTGGFAAILAFLTSPITLIGIALGTLIFLGIQLYKNWGALTARGTWLGEALRFIKNMAMDAWNSIRNFINILSQIKMPSGLQSIINAFNTIKAGLGKDLKNIGNLFKGRIPGHANGVRNSPGGLAVVGERGPELVNLPKGADVFSNEESRRMTAGGGGITIETMNIKSGVDWELGASYMAQKLRLS
jgi:tape measure domain-containing protein